MSFLLESHISQICFCHSNHSAYIHLKQWYNHLNSSINYKNRSNIRFLTLSNSNNLNNLNLKRWFEILALGTYRKIKIHMISYSAFQTWKGITYCDLNSTFLSFHIFTENSATDHKIG